MAIAWDDFTRTSNAQLESHTPTGTNAGSGWTLAVAGGGITVNATTDRIVDNQANGNRYRMNTDMGSDEMDVQLDVIYNVVDGGVFFGPIGRMSNSGYSGWEFQYDGGDWVLTDGTSENRLTEAWPGGTVTMLLEIRTGYGRGLAGGVEKVRLTSDLLRGQTKAGLMLGNFIGASGQVEGDLFKSQGVVSPRPRVKILHVPAVMRASVY